MLVRSSSAAESITIRLSSNYALMAYLMHEILLLIICLQLGGDLEINFITKRCFSVFLLPLDMRRILLSGSHLLSTKEMFEDNYDILKLLDHLLNSCFLLL